MKNKHFRHCDFIKVSKHVAENPKILKGYLVQFLSQPIQFKDKRRNVELYEITDLQISNNNLDDFVKETYTIIRTISYKTNK